MGSPLSPSIANLVIEELEQWALKNLSFSTPFYARYVDDIITAIPGDKIVEILEVFNKFHSKLKFTHEIEKDG